MDEMKFLMGNMTSKIKAIKEENNEYKKHMKALSKENEKINKKIIIMKEQMETMKSILERTQNKKRKTTSLLKILQHRYSRLR